MSIISRQLLPVGLLLLTIVPSCKTASQTDREIFIITDNAPAKTWDCGYGVGNGRLGALAYGGFPNETIVLNEGSIFAHEQIKYAPNAKAALAEARRLCNEGRYKQADELFVSDILHTDPSYAQAGSYQSGGLLKVDFVDNDSVKAYSRSLDMLSAMATTTLTFDDGTLTTSLISIPEVDCVAYRIVSTRKHGVTADFALTHPSVEAELEDQSTWVLAGQADNGGTKFENRLVVKCKGGKQSIVENKIRVEGAREILVLSSTTTDYNIVSPDQPLSVDLAATNRTVLAKAEKLSWRKMAQLTESYFTEPLLRGLVDIGSTAQDVKMLTTPQRIERVKSGQDDPDLVEKLFQFGRYCVVANSRAGGLPCGLQGLWNPDQSAPWRGCYFLNINCQMNYWLTEPTNLSEFHQPFLDLVLGMQRGGEEFAKELGYDGFCYGHNTDCWRKTYFRGSNPEWSASLLNGAWATSHLLEHYRFAADTDLLKRSMPLLRSNALFITEWFKPDSLTGEYLSGPGTSPETGFYADYNGKPTICYVSNGNSHDLLIGRESLRNYLYACNELGINDDTLILTAKRVLAGIPLPKIGSDGRLMEWREPFEEKDKGHRHFSHCYGLFPGNEFDIINTPQYAEAARRSIDFRVANGSGHTGWSESWIISLYATLHQGNEAWKHINKLISRNINPNLFDMHPPFQIDGNFGLSMGLTNCLIQSQVVADGRRIVMLLPAKADCWTRGSAKGLRTRGGLSVDMTWDAGKVTATVSADRDGDFGFMCNNQTRECSLKKGETRIIEF